jgi:FKBP-type peptidyl-prolyl cis-trans isomerase
VAKPHQRVFALILAVLFLATSVAAGASVIWQINQDNKNNASDTETTADENQASEQPKEGQLQGTKLEGFEPIAQPVTAVQKTDIQEGTGEEVKSGATITFHYTGALTKDGTIFQSSHDGGQPATFPLAELIKGWQEGIPGMKVGGKRRLIIPYEKGYGEAGSGDGTIPAKADLVFDIEITDVKNP